MGVLKVGRRNACRHERFDGMTRQRFINQRDFTQRKPVWLARTVVAAHACTALRLMACALVDVQPPPFKNFVVAPLSIGPSVEVNSQTLPARSWTPHGTASEAGCEPAGHVPSCVVSPDQHGRSPGGSSPHG